MLATSFRRALSRAILIAALGGAPAAFAADKPATPAGAASLQDFFSRLLPKPAAGAPPLATVKADGPAYVVAFDLGSVNSLMAGMGWAVRYDPTQIVYKLFEQDDGKWRLVMDSFPKLVAHAEDVTTTLAVNNFAQTLVIDPAIAWWTGGSASADGGSVVSHGAGVDQSVSFGALKVDYATSASANGAVSSTAKKAISDVGLKIKGQTKDERPVDMDGHFDSLAFNVGFDGLKTRKLFDAWSLVSANPDNLAPHADALKGLLHEIAAPGVKLAEGAEGTKALFSSPYGAISLGAFKVATGLSNAGPDSALDVAISASELSLPVGLTPPGAGALTPSKIELAATLKGVDFAAAASAAIDHVSFEGAHPKLSDDDMAQVAAALLSAGPLRVEIAPSHIVAPALDANLQGVVRYAAGHVTGSMTIRMRNFDATMAALKGLGPDIQAKALPALAMAKGLAKSDSDGSLSWVVEVDEHRSISVNGIPLGKAPG
jgi:hypothetical protein